MRLFRSPRPQACTLGVSQGGCPLGPQRIANQRAHMWLQRLLVTALLFVFALQLIHVARLYSATWDEAHHLYDGYHIWTRGDYRLNAEVPPLVKLTAALPLLPMHLTPPPDSGHSQAKEAFLQGRAFVFGNGGDRVLFPARMACMLFALLLAFLVYAAARAMFGMRAALIALLLFVFDPNVLANGTLVTTDIGSACCLFGSIYAYYRYTRAGSRSVGLQWLLVTSLAAGLTLVAKFTGILLAPMLLLLALLESAATRSLPLLGKRLVSLLGVFLCAWVVLWAFYGFRYKPAAPGHELSPALTPYIASMPNGKGAGELTLAARYHLLPQPYIWGLANTRKTEWEYTSYFFGRIYRHGPWQYFPAAFLIKSTLPLLLLLLLFPFVWFAARKPGKQDSHSRELFFLLVPVCVYFAVVTTSHFDIGARHLLPIYPFLYVLAAAGAARLSRCGPAAMALVSLLLAAQAFTSLRVAPAYMAYGNEAWGGPSAVHRYLSDANVDWGQQLKSVKLYLDQNHITNCWFAYFPDGAVDPSDYGVHCKRLPTATSLWWLKQPMSVPPVIDGTVLISDSDLEGVESGDQSLNPYDAFRAMQPVAVIQHGVDVYRGRFAVPLASALVAVRASGERKAAGEPDAALAIAYGAVALAPGSAIVQANLADLLSTQGRWAEALAHYKAAQEQVQSVRPDLQSEELAPGIAAGIAKAQSHL